MRGDLETARELAEELLVQAQRVNDRALLVGAHHEMGGMLSALGELVSALWHFNQGLAFYNSDKQSPYTTFYGNAPGVACLARSGIALWFLGYPDQAIAKSREAIALAEQLCHPNSLAYALGCAEAVSQFCGRETAALEQADVLIKVSTEYGFPFWKTAGTILRGWAFSKKGRSEEGLVQIQEGMASWKALGVEVETPYFLSLIAESYGQDGRVQEGLAVLAEALNMVERNREHSNEAEVHRLRGELLLQTPEKRETKAEQCFQKVIDIARHQSAKSLELRATMSLGRLWKQQGKRSEALRILEEVYNWFTEGFETEDLREVKELLEELSRSDEKFFLDRK